MTHEPRHERDHEDLKNPATDQRSETGSLPEPALEDDAREPAPAQVAPEVADSRAPTYDAQVDSDTLLRAEAMADRLETLLERAPQCVQTITDTLDRFGVLAASVTGAAEESLEKAEATCIHAEALEKKLCATAEHLAAEGENVERKTELLLRGLDAGDVVQDRLQECNEQLKLLAGESEKVVAERSEKLRELVETCDERLAALEQSAGQVAKDTVEAVTRRIQTAVAESEQRLSTHQTQTAATTENLRLTNQTIERDLQNLGESVLKKVQGSIAGRLREFEQETGETAGGHLRRLTSVIEEAGTASGKLKKIDEAAGQRAERLANQLGAAAELEEKLGQTTAAARETSNVAETKHTEISTTLAEVDKVAKSLTQQLTDANGVHVALGQLNTEAKSTSENLDNAGEAAGQRAERLANQLGSAAELEGKLSRTTAAAGEVLVTAIEESKERMEELRTGMADAAQQRDEIAEQYRQALATATEAADRVDVLIKEVWSLTTGTEQRARELAAEVRDAGELLKKLSPVKAEVETLQQGITRQGEAARALLEQLQVQTGCGDKTSDRLRAIHADCTRVGDQLASHCDNAKSIAERISKIAAGLHQDHDNILANRETLSHLSEQSRSLGDMVQQTQLAAESLRIQVNGLLNEPQAVVCDAKQQALQLTNVCRAVKKVFSGLSKTSLLATKETERLTTLHSEVMQTTRTLHSEVMQTTRAQHSEVTQATRTLQQWVNEAAHVQQRLESTVQHAPGIAQTHSPARLYSLAEPHRQSRPAPSDKAPTRSAKSRDDRPTDTPASTTPVGSGRGISPELVAELVADAKRQHEREKHLAPAL